MGFPEIFIIITMRYVCTILLPCHYFVDRERNKHFILSFISLWWQVNCQLRFLPTMIVLRHHIPELLNTFPKYLIDKIKTHSLYSISHHIKCYLVDSYSYDCSIIDCYICNNIWKWQVAEVETLVLRPTVIADRSLGSRNGNPLGGRRLLSGRWLLRFSKDTNGSITLRSISTSEWIMTLFAMASLIEFVPLLSLCILDPVRELAHYFRWLNARETYPQCTEAASLVSFALSHPFVICHKLNMTLYCASITTVHAFPFRVASMPAVNLTLVEVSQHAYDYLYIRTIVLFVFLRNSCKPDMVLVYIFVE